MHTSIAHRWLVGKTIPDTFRLMLLQSEKHGPVDAGIESRRLERPSLAGVAELADALG